MSDYPKNVQDVQLYILKSLINLFKQENITYIAVGGTALGAVRHQGFIPWDDDIDIALPREDYERFLKLKDRLPEDLFLQHFDTEKEYLLYYAKVRKNGTVFLEERDKNQSIHTGVSLDVFPLDFVEGDGSRAKNFVRLERRFARVNKNYQGFVGKLKSVIYRMIYPNAEICFKELDKFVRATNTKNKNKLGPPHSNWFLSEDELYPIKEIAFEDAFIAIPNKIELYLERKYGDYMSLPAEKDRVAHQPIEVKI